MIALKPAHNSIHSSHDPTRRSAFVAAALLFNFIGDGLKKAWGTLIVAGNELEN